MRTVQSDLLQLRRDLAERVLDAGEGLPVEEALETHRLERIDRHARLDQFMQTVAQEQTTNLDPLLVAARQIRTLAVE